MRLEALAVELSALRHWDFPLAALTAYGALRILEEEQGKEATLCFVEKPWGPVPVLCGLDRDSLLEALADHLSSLDRQGLKIHPDASRIKDLGGEYFRFLGEAVSQGDRHRAAFLQAYLAPNRRDMNRPIPTPFDTTKGRQAFFKTLDEAHQLAGQLGFPAGLRRVLFEEGVLIYPGEVIPSAPQLGWHGSQYREWADRARNPSEEKECQRVRVHPVAVLLAWEALPLYPMALGAGLEPRPIGFLAPQERGASPSLVLPLPRRPVGAGGLRALIAAGPVAIAAGRGWPRDVELWVSPMRGSKGAKGAYPTFMGAKPWDARTVSGA
jgi:hypothetical protein